MNLQSPIFDMVRIPSRNTPQDIIDRACAAAGVRFDDLLAAKRWTPALKALRDTIIVEMRDAKCSKNLIASHFHRHVSQVNAWIAEMDEAS